MARKNAKARPSKERTTLLPEPSKDEKKTTLVFFHPDLGIGGAERLVVDAAVGLQERGHRVVIFTNHCDPNHCFDECRDGTLDVRVRGAMLFPMSIFNRLTILCAILRHLHLLFIIYVNGELSALKPHAIIVDQLSAGLPLLAYLCPAAPILFYCHFPDLLLARGRESAVKRLYRWPFDALEQRSMTYAHTIAVNSLFTRDVVAKTWPKLIRQVPIRVVYPCVDTTVPKDKDLPKVLEGEKVILSINRFERKKDIGLAIKAFAAVPEAQRKGVRLVIAGGYDPRIDENVQHLKELQSLASSLSLTHATIASTDAISSAPPIADGPVLFLPSVPGPTKDALLRAARLLVYTPAAEHFGIVPLEAMLARVPVLAATTGGPVETVRDGATGWLRDTTDVQAWADVMSQALSLTDAQARAIGEAGARRVREGFGRDRMAERLDYIVNEIRQWKPMDSYFVALLVTLSVIALTFFLGIGGAKAYWTIKEAVLAVWGDVSEGLSQSV